ncbi:MAG: PilX N-terminal domain-containing pilus assembly protein [Polaromonas sp.]|nr:PilX N-terminal domain-containing pilus assembly protein [Polaromonas sp.]
MSPINLPIRATPLRCRRWGRVTQSGVVLIISLIMLVVISLLATLSIRNATSSEKVSANVRTTELASQAAEIALRYCEEAVLQISSGTGTLTSLPTVLSYTAPVSPNKPFWLDTANWDGSTSTPFVIPDTSVNQTDAEATFKRMPECMVVNTPVVDATGVVSTASTYTITARGFGPEVPAVTSARVRPTGSEVWMQSTIELE